MKEEISKRKPKQRADFVRQKTRLCEQNVVNVVQAKNFQEKKYQPVPRKPHYESSYNFRCDAVVRRFRIQNDNTAPTFIYDYTIGRVSRSIEQKSMTRFAMRTSTGQHTG